MFYLPIVLMILATTLYHLAQKSVPTQVNPDVLAGNELHHRHDRHISPDPSLPAAYGRILVLRNVNWASCAVGISIVGVELAVLLAYRTGWKISLVSVIGNTASALLLVGIGLLFFHEHLSVKSLAGVALCLVGLALITQH